MLVFQLPIVYCRIVDAATGGCGVGGRCLTRSIACEYNISQDSISTPGDAARILEPIPTGSIEETTTLALGSVINSGSTLSPLSASGPLASGGRPVAPEPNTDCQSGALGDAGAEGADGRYLWGGQLLAHDVQHSLDDAAMLELDWMTEADLTSGQELLCPTPVMLPRPLEENENQESEEQKNQVVPDGRSSLSAPLFLTFQPKSILEPADHFAQLIARSSAATAAANATNNTKKLLPGMLSIDQIARIVGEYPMRMLLPTFRSPFIHPTLCRQHPGGVPKHMAVALACVSMKLHMEASGMEFVCETMSTQRDNLIKELVSGLYLVEGKLFCPSTEEYPYC